MAEFTVNPTRHDPYQNIKFRVKWDGAYVAGVSKVSGLKRSTEVVEHREGGDPSTSRKSPGRTQFDAITLERGLTQDLAFANWANKVWTLGGNPEVALADFRKDIVIDFYNEADQLVISYKVHRCWGRSIRHCLIWTPMRTRSPSNTSNWRTRDGSATCQGWNRKSRRERGLAIPTHRTPEHDGWENLSRRSSGLNLRGLPVVVDDHQRLSSIGIAHSFFVGCVA